MDPILTGVYDVDRTILMDLDDQSLGRMCSTRKSAQRICSDDLFWRDRFIKLIGEHLLQYKPQHSSYRDYYVHLSSLPQTDEQVIQSTADGRLDEMIYLLQRGIDANPIQLLEAASAHGRLQIIKWLLMVWAYEPAHIERALEYAIFHDQIEVLELFLSAHLLDGGWVGVFFREGDALTLDWLVERGYQPNANDYHTALVAGNIEAVDWFTQIGRFPDANDARVAVLGNDLGLLDHLYRRYGLLPNLNPHDIATIRNEMERGENMEVNQWLAHHGLL